MIEEKNYYGNLCTEMYEILHAEAPQDELNFYLSYAEKGKKIFRTFMRQWTFSCSIRGKRA